MTEKGKAFIQLYGAYFGRLTEDDGRDYILRWVDKPEVSLDILSRVCEKISRNDDRYRPRLGKLKRIYKEFLTEPVNIEHGRTTNCEQCHGGKVHVILAGDGAGQLRPLRRLNNTPRVFPYMVVSMIPCVCDEGMAANAQLNSPYSTEMLNTLHQECAFPYGAAADKFILFCKENADA